MNTVSIFLKVETQLIGGILVKRGINNIEKSDWDKIQEDSWGKKLVEEGLIYKMEMRKEELEPKKAPTPPKTTKKSTKGKKK